MPHTTHWENKGILWVYTGVTTTEEVARANTEFYRNPQSDFCKYQIFDALQADEIVGTESEIKALAAIDFGASRSIKNLKIALVVRPHMQEAAEYYIQVLAEMGCSWDCRIFHSMEETRRWTNPDEFPE